MHKYEYIWIYYRWRDITFWSKKNDRTATFTYSLLGKALEKQTKKQVDALKSLKISNKMDELRQIENTFPQNQRNDLILHRLEEIIQLQNDIKLNVLNYKAKSWKKL